MTYVLYPKHSGYLGLDSPQLLLCSLQHLIGLSFWRQERTLILCSILKSIQHSTTSSSSSEANFTESERNSDPMGCWLFDIKDTASCHWRRVIHGETRNFWCASRVSAWSSLVLDIYWWSRHHSTDSWGCESDICCCTSQSHIRITSEICRKIMLKWRRGPLLISSHWIQSSANTWSSRGRRCLYNLRLH